MLNDRYVFSQLLDFLPKHEFDRCVERYHGILVGHRLHEQLEFPTIVKLALAVDLGNIYRRTGACVDAMATEAFF